MAGNKKLVVTLASYPPRIDAAFIVVENMLTKQTLKPTVVILNLFEGHFPNRRIPSKFDKLIKLGLSIYWHKTDMKSYNKFLHTYKKFSNDLVVTIDDDLHYPEDLLIHLVEGHNKWPKAVIASATFLMTFNIDGTPKSRREWIWQEKEMSKNIPNKWLYFGSGAGTLLVPKWIMTDKFDLLNATRIREEAPTNDEAWLNVARILNDIEVVLYDPLYTVEESVIDGTERVGLHCTLNNTPEEYHLHDKLIKKYNITNRNLGPHEKWLMNRTEQNENHIIRLESEKEALGVELTTARAQLSSFLGIKRSAKLLAGNIKRRIIKIIK